MLGVDALKALAIEIQTSQPVRPCSCGSRLKFYRTFGAIYAVCPKHEILLGVGFKTLDDCVEFCNSIFDGGTVLPEIE